MGKNGIGIKINIETKTNLNKLKVIPEETYNGVIVRLINFYLNSKK